MVRRSWPGCPGPGCVPGTAAHPAVARGPCASLPAPAVLKTRNKHHLLATNLTHERVACEGKGRLVQAK